MGVVRKAVVCSWCSGDGCEMCQWTGFGEYYAGRVLDAITQSRWESYRIGEERMFVFSVSVPGKLWEVTLEPFGLRCTCPAYEMRGWCRHVFALHTLSVWMRLPEPPYRLAVIDDRYTGLVLVLNSGRASQFHIPVTKGIYEWLKRDNPTAAQQWLKTTEVQDERESSTDEVPSRS